MPNEGPKPLLLLHGFPMTAAMWRHTVAHFSTGRTVVAPEAGDLIRAALENPSMEAMAGATCKALEAAAPGEPAVVAGLSMGGYIAMEFARYFPERVAALVLCDTRCSPDTEEARANRNAMIEAVQERGVVEGTFTLTGKLLSAAAPQSVREEIAAMVARGEPSTIIAFIKALRDRHDHCATLQNVSRPSLVVRGADDALAPRDVTEEMARRLPNSRLVEIPNAGHVPPLEAPDAFNAALEGFLRENNL